MSLLRFSLNAFALAAVAVTATAFPVGDIDPTFVETVGANGAVWSIGLDASQRIIIGGDFTDYGGIPRSRVARLNVNGTLDTTFNPGIGANGSVQALAVQTNGKVVIAGLFTSVQGISRGGVARLNTDGSLDATFNPGAGANVPIVFGLALQPDNKPILGGYFTQYSSVTKPRVARALIGGTNDSSFAGSANNSVYSVALQPDGKILVGGVFTKLNGANRGGVGRFNADGTIDTTFTGGTTGEVNAVRVQSDGRVLVAGYLSSSSGFVRRLFSNGQPDATMSSATNGAVWSITIQSDGKILIGGAFSNAGGVAKGRLARYNADGTLDPDFAASPGANSTVLSVATQLDGRILIGGTFTAYNGALRGRIARVLPVSSCYVDQDGDGHGAGTPTGAMSPCGVGFAPVGGDCDDFRASVYPSAPEICDGLDNDCDGSIDEGLILTYYRDADGDGYGTPLSPLVTCNSPSGYVLNSLDCDDAISSVYTGAPEICDGLDNDCDGSIDPGFITTYCTAGTTVFGCIPSILGEGAPSSSSPSGFNIVVSHVPAQRVGLIFYGQTLIPQPQPWAVGSASYLCIYYPVSRTGAYGSGGAAGTCTGELRVDFNQFMANNPAATGSPFHAGQVLHAQGWFRDPGAAKQTNLSNALTFTLCN